MNVRRAGSSIALLITLIATSMAAGSEAPDSGLAPLPVTLGRGSVLWLEGTSTLHGFESRSQAVEIELLRGRETPNPSDASDLVALMGSSSVRGAVVRVPVVSLRSDKAALDKNLRKTLRAEQYPTVRFDLGHYDVDPDGATGDTIAIRARGWLTISGQARPVTLETRAHRADMGVWLEGSHALRMSEYGIAPPTLMLGTLRVGDRVTVRYRLLLVPQVAPPHATSPGGK
jgi:YceI-like protein